VSEFRTSGDLRQCWLATAPHGHADAGKADEHHRPSSRFRHRRGTDIAGHCRLVISRPSERKGVRLTGVQENIRRRQDIVISNCGEREQNRAVTAPVSDALVMVSPEVLVPTWMFDR